MYPPRKISPQFSHTRTSRTFIPQLHTFLGRLYIVPMVLPWNLYCSFICGQSGSEHPQMPLTLRKNRWALSGAMYVPLSKLLQIIFTKPATTDVRIIGSISNTSPILSMSLAIMPLSELKAYLSHVSNSYFFVTSIKDVHPISSRNSLSDSSSSSSFIPYLLNNSIGKMTEGLATEGCGGFDRITNFELKSFLFTPKNSERKSIDCCFSSIDALDARNCTWGESGLSPNRSSNILKRYATSVPAVPLYV